MPKPRTHRGAHYNQGARCLAQVLEERNLTHRQAELLLGAPTGLVSGWVHGDKRPGLKYLFLLRNAFAIEPELWSLPAKTEKAQRSSHSPEGPSSRGRR